MPELTIEEILAALSERGRLEWEAATQRAIIEAQRAEIEALSNGKVTVAADDYDIHDD